MATMLAACPFRGGQGELFPGSTGGVNPSGSPLSVKAERTTLTPGEDLALTVSAPANAVIQYTSSVPGVATVDAKGIVKAVNVGTTTIRATFGQVAATVTIKVVTSLAPEFILVDTVEIQPGSQTVQRVGSQLVFTAVVKDAQKVAIPGVNVFWFSSDPRVATISAAGVLTIVGTGSTEVTAAAGDKRSAPSVITVPGGSVNVNVDFGAI
jgi:uncharacterized protein YjdB